MCNKVLDIISTWDKPSQWFLFALAMLCAVGLLGYLLKVVAVLVRGWPPSHEQ